MGILHLAPPGRRLRFHAVRRLTPRPRFAVLLALLGVCLLALSGCGGRARGDSVVEVDGPGIPEPERIAIRTLEPAPDPTPTPTPTPATPTPVPTPTPPGVPAPQVASMKAASGTQLGDVGSYCWAQHEGGPQDCFRNDEPSQADFLPVKQQEKVLLSLDAQIPPDEESIRPFQDTRSGYPDQAIAPALETELTIDLPKGEWSMDLCAVWHGRGQSICWLFAVSVS